MSKNLNGKKTIRYNDKDYFITKLLHITKDSDINHNYKEGECVDLVTGEIFDIKNIDKIYEEKYKEFNDSADIVGYDRKSNIKRNTLDKDFNMVKMLDLENKFNNSILTIDELKELIILKYGERYNVYLNYEHFIKLNTRIPELTHADLGKFYIILTKLTQKSNTLLKKLDIRSNPLTKKELCELLNLELKAVEQFLKRLKDKGIIKHVSIGDKKHYMVNPIYAFNGSIVGSYTYVNFKDEIGDLADIPEELKMLWDYEFINSTVQDT